jgi:hypothetical protein
VADLKVYFVRIKLELNWRIIIKQVQYFNSIISAYLPCTCKHMQCSGRDAFQWKLAKFGYSRQTETPEPVDMKFCATDKICNLTWRTKISLNRCTGGGYPREWNIRTSSLILTTLGPTDIFPFFLVCPYRPDRSTELHTKMTRWEPRKCLSRVTLIRNYIYGSNIPKPPSLTPECRISSQT